ncbi:unnamed protein product [Ambrosiozyma monospora]|uniref:Unnamed protein product n=1 Tax=Ambrosiozyma monospora TaxID=43982 RepID=A0ACB5UDI7_AMBMO|nr:unnamed protein product [Ambrosiozyma monospora]
MDIQVPCSDFDSICRNWASFDKDLYSLGIKYVKLYDLPNDVYDEDEKRPHKMKKRKNNKNGVGSKKMKVDSNATSTDSHTDQTPVSNSG